MTKTKQRLLNDAVSVMNTIMFASAVVLWLAVFVAMHDIANNVP